MEGPSRCGEDQADRGGDGGEGLALRQPIRVVVRNRDW